MDRQPRRRIVAGDVPAWVRGGRWGTRRARVEECAAILKAELVYDDLIRHWPSSGPGTQARLEWKPVASGASWHLAAEVLPNAVWRRGRVFLRCPHCTRRATRLYVPVAGLEPRCRRCWGLNYSSQSRCYNPIGGLLPLVAYIATLEHRERRQRAARARYAARRAFLTDAEKLFR